MEMLGWRLCYGSSTSYLMTWLWIPHASSWSSTYECVGLLRTFHPLLTSRFTFQHLPTFVFCLFCVVVWFCCLLCFWFLFCKCLGIPNSPRSLDLDDRQGLIARSAMQQKKKWVSCLDTSSNSLATVPSFHNGYTFWVPDNFQLNDLSFHN